MITFTYDKKIEGEILNKFVKPGKSPEVFKLIKSELKNVKINLEEPIISSTIKQIESNWREVESNFYKKLGEFYGKNISAPNITCFLTRTDIFPYNFSKNAKPKWFASPLFANPSERNRVIMHELCHYFQPVELPRDIKEAIPVILNDHEAFMMYSYDRGHKSEEEQKWRKVIWEIYKKGGTFKNVLEKVGK